MNSTLAVLGDEKSYYVKDLLRAAADLGQSIKVSDYGELRSCTRPALQTSLKGNSAVLVRSMPLGSLEQVIFRMNCLQLAAECEMLVVNAPRTLETTIDKWLTLHRLSVAGIDVPNTVVCQDKKSALEAFESLGSDVVVKPVFGGEGRGIIRIQDKDLAWRVFGALQQTRSVYYVQQFMDHFGYDIRVLLIGDRCLSIQRHASCGEWKTNLAQGSRAVAHSLTSQERDLAVRSATAVAGQTPWVLGVDLLPCRDGSIKVIEVNGVPGWKGVNSACDVDVAREIISFVRNQVEDRE